MDLGNLTQPWVIDPADFNGAMVGFKNSPNTEPISLAELELEYCRATRQPYPIAQMIMTFAQSWMLLRVRSPFTPLSPLFRSHHHRARLSLRSSRRESRRDMREVRRVRSRRIFTPPRFR